MSDDLELVSDLMFKCACAPHCTDPEACDMCAKEVCVYCKSARAIERLTAEVEQWRTAFNKLQERALAKEQALSDCTAERDRLKAVLKPLLNAKVFEVLKEILEAMEGLNEADAPYLKTLLDWHERARKALEDDKQ